MVKIKKVYEPDMEKHQIYKRQYEKFKILFNSLSDLFALDAKDNA